MAQFPEPPDSGIPVIERSEHKREIFTQLLSGWSPTRVAMSLRRKYGETIDPRDILGFLASIAKDDQLSEGELRKRYKLIDVDVDALLEMQLLLRLQRDQLDAALLQQEMAKQAGTPNLVTKDNLDRAARRYWVMLTEYLGLMHEIGELAPPPDIPQLTSGSGGLTIKQVIEMRRTTITQGPAQPMLPEAVEGQVRVLETSPSGIDNIAS